MDRVLFDGMTEREVKQVQPGQGNGGNVDPALGIHKSGLQG